MNPGDPKERVRVDVHLSADVDVEARKDLRQALEERPRRIPSRFFYDDRGSELFEEITELPEYYPTRTEAAILRTVADDVAARSRAGELVELGSGAATKTRILLDALERTGRLQRYVPMDVSEAPVRRSAQELASRYPDLEVHGVVGDFLQHLDRIPDSGVRRLVVFLGGTIGNFLPEGAVGFLRTVHDAMSSGDYFLLGTDLVKDVARLEAAYDDSKGVTAEFNKNILRVVNRLTDGDFDPDRFRHRAFYDLENRWIEMRLVSREEQTIHLPGIDLTFDLAEGEEILTEISAKYDREKVQDLLTHAGFEPVEWYTDDEKLFGLTLARRGPHP